MADKYAVLGIIFHDRLGVDGGEVDMEPVAAGLGGNRDDGRVSEAVCMVP